MPTEASKRTMNSRQSAIDRGALPLHGLLPPESAVVARAMVEQGYARSAAHACHLALLRMVDEDSK